MSEFPNFPNFPSTFSSSESTNGNGCTLSPSASAFSAMLSAFIGSIFNGLTSGWLVAFMTGWIAWFALVRVMVAGLYMLYRSVTNSWGPGKHEQIPGSGVEDSGYLMYNNNELNAGEDEGRAPTTMPPPRPGLFKAIWPPATVVRAVGPDQGKGIDLNRDVTILGWFGWVYGALYAPITQCFWIAANANNNRNGAVKIVKGFTIAVTALPLGVDCRVRYADSLNRKWASYLFNLANCISCVTQGVFSAILLIQGVIDLKSSSGFPLPLVGIYPIFSIIWMFGSFALLPMRDGGRKRAGQAHWAGYFIDIGMGAFAGLFLAAPAFGLYQDAQFDKLVAGDNSGGMTDLTSYLKCETQLWKKFAAVVP